MPFGSTCGSGHSRSCSRFSQISPDQRRHSDASHIPLIYNNPSWDVGSATLDPPKPASQLRTMLLASHWRQTQGSKRGARSHSADAPLSPLCDPWHEDATLTLSSFAWLTASATAQHLVCFVGTTLCHEWQDESGHFSAGNHVLKKEGAKKVTFSLSSQNRHPRTIFRAQFVLLLAAREGDCGTFPSCPVRAAQRLALARPHSTRMGWRGHGGRVRAEGGRWMGSGVPLCAPFCANGMAWGQERGAVCPSASLPHERGGADKGKGRGRGWQGEGRRSGLPLHAPFLLKRGDANKRGGEKPGMMQRGGAARIVHTPSTRIGKGGIRGDVLCSRAPFLRVRAVRPRGDGLGLHALAFRTDEADVEVGKRRGGSVRPPPFLRVKGWRSVWGKGKRGLTLVHPSLDTNGVTRNAEEGGIGLPSCVPFSTQMGWARGEGGDEGGRQGIRRGGMGPVRTPWQKQNMPATYTYVAGTFCFLGAHPPPPAPLAHLIRIKKGTQEGGLTPFPFLCITRKKRAHEESGGARGHAAPPSLPLPYICTASSVQNEREGTCPPLSILPGPSLHPISVPPHLRGKGVHEGTLAPPLPIPRPSPVRAPTFAGEGSAHDGTPRSHGRGAHDSTPPPSPCYPRDSLSLSALEGVHDGTPPPFFSLLPLAPPFHPVCAVPFAQKGAHEGTPLPICHPPWPLPFPHVRATPFAWNGDVRGQAAGRRGQGKRGRHHSPLPAQPVHAERGAQGRTVPTSPRVAQEGLRSPCTHINCACPFSCAILLEHLKKHMTLTKDNVYN
ncbi:hypothetical protein EDB83DRAFT_2313744 [Lactarius deliciosus]|nr:hypothetical protein EDB83DRAFT_2313744 [Lactarius deliciosus]